MVVEWHMGQYITKPVVTQRYRGMLGAAPFSLSGLLTLAQQAGRRWEIWDAPGVLTTVTFCARFHR